MGHGYPCVGRHGDRRSDAGHDLERHPVRPQEERFFTAATEDERVAAFQPHHPLALSCPVDEQLVDRLLVSSVVGLLANVDPLGSRRGERQEACVGETVVDDDVRPSEDFGSAQCQEPRVTCPAPTR